MADWMAQPSSFSSSKIWRTAFLTLRDETLTVPPSTSIAQLLHNLILCNSNALVAAAPDLPPHEVMSDILFMLELIANVCPGGRDMIQALAESLRLIHDVSLRVLFEFNSSSWIMVLDSTGKMMTHFIELPAARDAGEDTSSRIGVAIECLQTIRCMVNMSRKRFLYSEDIELVKFLVKMIQTSHAECCRLLSWTRNGKYANESRVEKCEESNLWVLMTLAFNLLAEAISRNGSSFSVDIWESIIEVFSKQMDDLSCKKMFFEGQVTSRFYESLLCCLHLTLSHLKRPLFSHVQGYVAVLQMFISYGLPRVALHDSVSIGSNEKELSFAKLKSSLEEASSSNRSLYKPPHLRRKDGLNMRGKLSQGSKDFSDNESSKVTNTSSDSDLSDSDVLGRGANNSQTSKVRVAAILCIQDLFQADSKLFSTQWSLLLPTGDVLQQRKSGANLMTCLLFDPCLKARMTSASTLLVILEGLSSFFLQVAEHKEDNKCGSFTALSDSLGQTLMELHRGILYVLQRETRGRLLASLFKILMRLISATPYPRMPAKLLPSVIAYILGRIEEGSLCKISQADPLVAAIGCLTAALSTSPPSSEVNAMLLEEIFAGLDKAEKKPGLLVTLFGFAESCYNTPICLEALQALKAVSHNYPSTVMPCWRQFCTIICCILRSTIVEDSSVQDGCGGNNIASVEEKVITSAIKAVEIELSVLDFYQCLCELHFSRISSICNKLLDECLRAISGFQGAEDFLDDKLLDALFASDCVRTKKVSCAPSYELVSMEGDMAKNGCDAGTEQWSQAMEMHLPLILKHSSAMVRAALVTCFAGLTSAVFMSFTHEKQDFVISAVIDAVKDVTPAVRSAACRAIGIISCFPHVRQSAEILDKFIYSIKINVQDPHLMVRITASWALANLCDSIRYTDSDWNSPYIFSLCDCALHLTKDKDKIKSNAVRALGYLSRVYRCSSYPSSQEMVGGNVGKTDGFLSSTSVPKIGQGYPLQSRTRAYQDKFPILERIVQALISCVTTGNVKVQWNVCHALSNLFLNEAIKLQHMDWAPSVFSVLLLLLRDSSNYKIRIQAAAALAVPASLSDYGQSFSDIVQGVELTIENLGGEQNSAPLNSKYRVALQKQLMTTMLHVLGLCSSVEAPLAHFLVKKAAFFKEWFQQICMSLEGTDDQGDVEDKTGNQRKSIVTKALQSLIQVYRAGEHHAIAQSFEKLKRGIL